MPGGVSNMKTPPRVLCPGYYARVPSPPATNRNEAENVTTYTLNTTVNMPYDATAAATRDALSDQGCGILTEIDVAATLKDKLDVDVEPRIILGACRPSLAHEAMPVGPCIGAVLTCEIVVRSLPDSSGLVEASAPDAMLGLAGNQELDSVAVEAKKRISADLAAVRKDG